MQKNREIDNNAKKQLKQTIMQEKGKQKIMEKKLNTQQF